MHGINFAIKESIRINCARLHETNHKQKIDRNIYLKSLTFDNHLTVFVNKSQLVWESVRVGKNLSMPLPDQDEGLCHQKVPEKEDTKKMA